MAKNVLFLIHGIGNQSEGWSDDVQQLLTTEFDRYMRASDKQAQLPDELEFVEITYNDIFDSVWKRWANLADNLQPDANAPEVIQKIATLLGAPAGNGSHAGNNRSVGYAGDALLYVGFRLIRRLVLLRVMSVIATKVERSLGENIRTRFGVLSHSLGTAIAHDALQTLMSTDWAGGRWHSDARDTLDDAEKLFSQKTGRLSAKQRATIARTQQTIGPALFSPRRFQFDALYAVANTSRSLSRTTDPYHSLVRPNTSRTGATMPGICNYFYDFDHGLDPVPRAKQFETERLGAAQERAIDISVSHIYQENVHSLSHYLLNPKVHRFIFLKLCRSFGRRESVYVDRRFSEELKAASNPDFFPRRGGNFSDDFIESKVKEELLAALVDVLRGGA